MINHDYKFILDTPKRSKKHWFTAAVLVGLTSVTAIAALGFTNPSPAPEASVLSNAQSSQSIDLPLPQIVEANDAESLAKVIVEDESSLALKEQTSSLTWVTHQIESGDSLAKIFAAQAIPPRTLHEIMHSSDDAAALKRIKPGHNLKFAFDSDNAFQALTYDISQTIQLAVTKTPIGFDAQIEEKPIERIVSSAAGNIENSLFLDAKTAGLSDKTIMEMANIFGWDIDFAMDLREGDSFSLVYESRFLNGERIKDGAILAAEFINQGQVHRAIRYTDKNGNSEYYSPDGKNMRKTFLRTPIELARISSGFNLKRKHPVLNRVRAHKGVDYAAGTGTPIRVTGDGKVVFRGVKGGYGRVVVVQHGQKYSTLYAHMSKYGAYGKGSTVKQGQIIGYVGKTGLATGPHLHYEFRVDGVHTNPLTVKVPSAAPLAASLMADFEAQSKPLLAKLDQAKQTQLAQNAHQ